VDLLGDVALLAAVGVLVPLLGQIQATVQRSMTFAAGVDQEDADLTVIDLAEPAAPLAAHAAGVGAFLGEGAAIDDEDVPDFVRYMRGEM
jgi:hypothetical protein